MIIDNLVSWKIEAFLFQKLEGLDFCFLDLNSIYVAAITICSIQMFEKYNSG